MLLNLLVAEKSGFQLADGAEQANLQEISERMTREAMANMEPVKEADETIAAGGSNGKQS